MIFAKIVHYDQTTKDIINIQYETTIGVQINRNINSQIFSLLSNQYSPDAQDGRRKCGHPAHRQKPTQPENTIATHQ